MRDPTTAILGAAYRYTIEQLEPFLRSCADSLPDEDVYLFTERTDEPSRALAARYCPNVSLIEPDDMAIRRRFERIPRGRRILGAASLRFGRSRPGRAGLHWRTLPFSPAVARYLWYLDWYSNQPTGKYTHLLIADTRDVFFQRNPFLDERDLPLFTSEESIRMDTTPVNTNWYRTAYGDAAFDRIRDHPVLCSGVTGGQFGPMGNYLEGMSAEILEAGNKILLAHGYDQALHNHLLRTTPLGETVSLLKSPHALLVSMENTGVSQVAIGDDGTLCTLDGEAIAIVHQYDRHFELRAAVEKRLARIGRHFPSRPKAP